MSEISNMAYVDSTAQIGENVIIEPFAYVGKDAIIEDNVIIKANARVEHATIGAGSVISTGAVVGSEPQDLGYKGEPTRVLLGKGCQIREHATINRASGEGNNTIVGDRCLLMTGSHVAHNCVLGDEVIFANLVTIAGHCHVGMGAFIGGMCVVHQNVRIGEMVICSGFSGTRQDIPPYAKVDGRPMTIYGTNVIGLRRRGLSQDERTSLKRAYKYLWYSNLTLSEGIKAVRENVEMNKYVENLLNFCETTKRGIHGAKPVSFSSKEKDAENVEAMV